MAPAFEQITSFQNSRVKQVRRLRERRARDREARFVIDDTRDLLRALDCSYHVDYALFCPEIQTGDPIPFDRMLSGTVYQVSREIMEKVSYRQNPSPVVAVMEQKPLGTLDDLRARAGQLVLGLVDLQKPGNIGALLRTADATGFTTICLIDTALDIYNPNVIRSSTGACFLGNIYALSTAQALRFFQQAEYRIAAAVVDGQRTMFEADLRGKVALVLGTEDRGLPDTWSRAADERVRIPMMGTLADSLNVSVSGAVLMYEVLRQQQTL